MKVKELGKGLVSRNRSTQDERNLIVTVTEAGERLKDQALTVPAGMAQCAKITPEEAAVLYQILYKMLGQAE